MSKQGTNTDKEAVEYFKNYLQQEGFSKIEKLPTFSDVQRMSKLFHLKVGLLTSR